jgi:hypothetical protein
VAAVSRRAPGLAARALPVVVAIAALSACGSSAATSPSSSSSSSAAAQQSQPTDLQAAQAQTLQAAQALARELRAGGVAWPKDIATSYNECGSGSTLFKYVTQQPLEPFASAPAAPKFNARLVSELSGAGWKLTAAPKPAPGTALYNLAGGHGLGGQLLISDRPAGPTASLSIDSGCFDAGSVEGLGGVTSTYAEPSPSGAG